MNEADRFMEIDEEIERRRVNIKIDKDPRDTYDEFKHMLENKHLFEGVEETEYYSNQQENTLRAKLIAEEHIDNFTEEKIHIHIKTTEQTDEAQVQIKGSLVTEYPQTWRYQKTLWYYAYRSLYDKFLYGNVRAGYEPVIDDKIEKVIKTLKEEIEADQ